MKALLWVAVSIYLIGFAFVFSIEIMAGPVTFGLALVRALVWPLYLFFGIPKGVRLPMD